MARDLGNLCGIEASFRIVTPMFLGGATQAAELRAPSIKAMLRFWHRAVDPGFAEPLGPGLPRRESTLWGGTERNAGQSKVLLAVTKQSLEPFHWRDVDLRRFDEGAGRQRKNGLGYLGYPFAFKEHANRSAIAPGSIFTLRVTLRGGSGSREAGRITGATNGEMDLNADLPWNFISSHVTVEELKSCYAAVMRRLERAKV